MEWSGDDREDSDIVWQLACFQTTIQNCNFSVLGFPKNWTDLTWNQYNIHQWTYGRDSGRQSLNLSRCAQIGSRQFGELFWILLLNTFLTITDQIFGGVSQIFLSQYLFFC
ncbi:Hypothetical_protein [Hexamita inflata]|uniref:Hypothetical_protein n=1 Tax=Hexamita inflata TaxID=28002 RepID=A0AA86NQ85_9EUKA|nr:Hypothetical protein HINF_LOCUS11695 [Hexamita inflata]